MTHVRHQIRDAVVTSLTSGVTLVSGRVYKTRTTPIEEATDAPCVCVYTLNESIVSNAMSGGSRLLRQAQIAIDVYISNNSNPDDDADAVMAQIESSLGADVTLGGVSKDLMPQSVDIESSPGGHTPIVLARMMYLVEYMTSLADAETSI